MGGLNLETDAAEAGFDPARLARLERHYAKYVADGELAGWLLTVARNGRLAYVASNGYRDREAGLPVEDDTIWRLYSMAKPVTSVAAMMLYEEGAFQLNDPVSKFIPSFADVRVFAEGSDLKPVTVPAVEPVRIWHLLTHTSGLTYGFHRNHPVDAQYRALGFDMDPPSKADLADSCDIWAGLPLLFQPGTEWNYSVATDVLGRVVEVASGMGLDEFFASRIFEPLGMTDTAFWLAGPDRDRLAALYGAGADGKAAKLTAIGSVADHRLPFLGGGGGLIGTAADYHKFTSMLLATPASPAGSLNGARLLSPSTVSYMTRNHLPGGADIETFGRPLASDTPWAGLGFGLGFAVVIDPVPGRTVRSTGEFFWGGAASTAFFVDPATGVTAAFFTQLLPSNAHPIRPYLRQLVNQALVG